MNKFQYTEENQKEFDRIAAKYPKLDAMMLPALWLVQEQEGWVSPEAMIYVADKVGKTPIQVYEFATFYTMFNLKPIGTYHIELCKTLSCMLMGANDLKAFIKESIGIEPGQTSADGKFHLTEVECQGACGGAPMIALNHVYHENLTVNKLKTILEGCK